jgi:hypothetical protein
MRVKGTHTTYKMVNKKLQRFCITLMIYKNSANDSLESKLRVAVNAPAQSKKYFITVEPGGCKRRNQ